jgi:DNA primase
MKTGFYNQDQIKTVLENLGYKLSDKGREWRAKPLYRDSDNDTSLSIRKDSGFWIDFAKNYSGGIESLVERTLKKPKGFGETWLKKEGFLKSEKTEDQKREELPLSYERFFDKSLLEKLSPNYNYWIKRGVSKKTLEEFGGGLCSTGKMNGRYVFPIFDQDKNIKGFAGRSIYENNDIKWKLIGRRSEWSYPLFLTRNHIEEERSCIIVESIGDGLSLWDAGVKNFIISFGVNSFEHLYYPLIALDPEKIIISFNDDYKNGKSSGSGNYAAKNFQRSLLSFFNKDQVIIKLPTKNDFGEMTKEEILTWKKN